MSAQLIDRLVAVSLRQLGRLLRRRGLVALAERACSETASLDCTVAESMYAEAQRCWRAGQSEAARALVESLIKGRPDHAQSRNLLGSIHLAAGNVMVAQTLFEQAIELAPDLAAAHFNLGNVLVEREEFAAAEVAYRLALEYHPYHAEAHNNLGLALQELGRLDEALDSYQRALAIDPALAEAYGNLGNAWNAQGKAQEALDCYMKVLSLRPDHAEALNNCGVALQALGRYDEALAAYHHAVELKPDYADAHYNESLCRLRMGDFERGWAEYEWRWQRKEFPSIRRDYLAPLWIGKEDISGKTILLHSEQGLGDTIQFCRYAPLVSALGATVLMEVPATLRRLLATLEGVSQVTATGEPMPAFDYHCPLLSLPLALQTTMDSIPAHIPYLCAEPGAVKKWDARLRGIPGLRVGLVWAGSPRKGHRKAAADDPLRSIPLAAFAPLRSVEGVRFFSVQKGEPSEQLAKLKSEGWAGPVIADFSDELDDFSDTAAFTSCLDLVITCDTSVAHLAGAISKPVWVLSRFNGCWRWLVDRDDSPWYPTARLFRQPRFGDWASVVENVRDALSKAV